MNLLLAFIGRLASAPIGLLPPLARLAAVVMPLLIKFKLDPAGALAAAADR